MDNPLDILCLKPGDSLETACKNRNRLFLKYHPDKNPANKDLYQKVYDAYELLKKNPELLYPITFTTIPSIEKFIRIKANISMSDIYFNRKQIIDIQTKIFCRKCNGSGSNIKEATCSYCEGTGKIDSNILSLLGKSSTCSICHGTGINPEKVCSFCNGFKYEIVKKSISFYVTIQDYHKKSIILHNVGDQFKNDTYGSIVIFLEIEKDPFIDIEDNYFVVHDKILPVQKIIGDTKTISIFGRSIPYKIKKNSTDAYTVDKISKNLKQEIRIKYINIPPKLTNKSIELYKEILSIEKTHE